RTTAVDPSHASAARAHLGEVDHRDLQWDPGPGAGAAEASLAADLEVMRDRPATVPDDAGLRRCATHVERDHVGDAHAPADDPGGGDTGRAARLDRGDGA